MLNLIKALRRKDMKISKKYIRLALLLVLLIGLLPSISYAQVVYKGINSATAKGTANGKEVTDNSNSGTTITRLDDPNGRVSENCGYTRFTS